MFWKCHYRKCFKYIRPTHAVFSLLNLDRVIMNITIPKFFSSAISSKIATNLQQWKGKGCLHDPLAWRIAVPELASLDYKWEKSGQNTPLNTPRLMDVFRFFGSVSLDLRDVPGLGHGRVFLASKNESVQKSTRKYRKLKSFAAICITEDGGGTDLHSIKTTAVRKMIGMKLAAKRSTWPDFVNQIFISYSQMLLVWSKA